MHSHIWPTIVVFLETIGASYHKLFYSISLIHITNHKKSCRKEPANGKKSQILNQDKTIEIPPMTLSIWINYVFTDSHLQMEIYNP